MLVRDDRKTVAPELWRIEVDSLGEVLVPVNALYGAHAARGASNDVDSGVSLGDRPELVKALAQVKAAAASANEELGVISPVISQAIIDAATQVAAGQYLDQFPGDIVQGGGGTSANMNMNEVIANIAEVSLGGTIGEYRLVHPNDHVNASQSTNDVYPTALQLAILAGSSDAISGFKSVASTLDSLANAAGDQTRLGRTCLQDAIPVQIAASFKGQAHGIRRTVAALEESLEAMRFVTLGGTAVGNGFGAPVEYQQLAVRKLGEISGQQLKPTEDPHDAYAHLDPHLRVASDVVGTMTVIAKIAADLRLLSSGPVGGLGEVNLPAVQVGSSCMPKKVNPVIPELVMQTSYEIRGSRLCVESAVAAGELDLNVMEPVIAKHILGMLASAGAVAKLFASQCLAGLTWNREAVENHLAGSLSDRVMEASISGYDMAAGK